jgi:hypothetical protein
MGSSCELKFDRISVASQKSYVPDEFVCLFQEGDRGLIAGSGPGEENVMVGYSAGRAVIIERLDLMGYTTENARHHFEEWLCLERENYGEYEREEPGGWAAETGAALRALTYEEWLSRARDVLLTRYDFDRPMDEYKDETDRQMRDLSDGWLFYDSNILPIIRSFLIAFPDIEEVSLDISSLIGGGWINENERICETRRSPGLQPRSDLEPTVIIAEGSTDIAVLKKSLQKLYPYLTDYFAFFDYESPKVDGGASYLLKFLRAFAAARINTNIIAVFDNDAEGAAVFTQACTVPLPTNIRIMKLPDIELARNYPTFGPQGSHRIDVNGRAVSIELFLGRHNLLGNDGDLFPIIWSNRLSGSRQYQGALEAKQTVLSRFMEEINQDHRSDHYHTRFPELITLWEHFFTLRREAPRIIKLSGRY